MCYKIKFEIIKHFYPYFISKMVELILLTIQQINHGSSIFKHIQHLCKVNSFADGSYDY